MKNYLPLLILLLFTVNHPFYAQTGGSHAALSAYDSTSFARDSIDSLMLAQIREELNEARLNEMNLRLEIEALHMQSILQDSLKKAQQRQRIDSLRKISQGYPVLVEGDTLFIFYAKRGGLHPQLRARNAGKAILDLGQSFSISPDSIYVESTDIVTEIMYQHTVLASFTDQDGLWENTTRDELAATRRTVIIEKVKELQSEYGLARIVKRIVYFMALVALQIILIVLTNWLYRKVVMWILRIKDSKLKSIKINNYEILDTKKEVRLLVLLSSLVRYAFILTQLLILVPIIFSIFPQTRDLANSLFSYIWNPVKNIFASTINYIPNLFTILIIWLVIRYLVKGVEYLAKEISSEKLKISGFYPDWAQPTYQIVRFLLYAFMIAMIYPYLPGADSGVFQGVSVFVGLIVSLGSSSVISNIMAGLVMTYMRPFKIGDRIKLNDILGNVMERTPFVTRIKTIKNEIITVPNSFILTSHTVNYSASASKYGLIIHSEISFDFEQPFDKIHNLLIEAALMTDGVQADPPPFVHEISFEDFYPVYQINAYIIDADRTAQIKSDLHRHIQQLAAQAGIELLSPHYVAMHGQTAK